MSKGTTSKGKRNTSVHGRCRRCGRHSYHQAHCICAYCGFGKTAARRNYTWAKLKRGATPN